VQKGSADDSSDDEAGSKPAPAAGTLMSREDQEEGQVTGQVYGQYIVAYGVFSFLALIFLWSSEQAMRILTGWYLTQWSSAEVAARIPGGQPIDRITYIGGYLGFALGERLGGAVLSAQRQSRKRACHAPAGQPPAELECPSVSWPPLA
jgi:hypothetical protein